MLEFPGVEGLRIAYPHVLGRPGRRQIVFDLEGGAAVCRTCKEVYERTTPKWVREQSKQARNVIGEAWNPVFSVNTSTDPFYCHEKMYQHTVLHYLIEDGLDNQN